MKIQRFTAFLVAMIAFPFLISACERDQGTYTELDVAVAVASTLTASVKEVQQQPVQQPTVAPESVPSEALQPLSPEECNNLATTVGQKLGVIGEQTQASIEDTFNQLSGTGCQSQFVVSKGVFEHYGSVTLAVINALESQDWGEDFLYAASGPGAQIHGFRKANGLCKVGINLSAVDQALCADYASADTCCPNLEPEQCQFSVTLVCAQGDLPEPAMTMPESDPVRIEFPAGGTSKQLSGMLTPGSVDHYVLWAEANQQLNTLIYPPGAVSVAVIGDDGTVLKSDLDSTSDWTGVLPASQDYFIDVRSMMDSNTEYTLDVTIPPLTPIATTGEIAGSIRYTGETIPALHIVAYNIESNLWYYMKAPANSTFYTLVGLPPGKYQVVAHTQDDLVGAYVSAGELLEVTVNAGETTQSIDLISWYDPGSVAFPPDPVGW